MPEKKLATRRDESDHRRGKQAQNEHGAVASRPDQRHLRERLIRSLLQERFVDRLFCAEPGAGHENRTGTGSALTQLPTPRGPSCRGHRGEGTQSQGGKAWRDEAVCPQACFPSPEHQEDDIAQPPCSVMGSRDQWTMGESHGQHVQEVPRNLPTILHRPAEPRAGSANVLRKGQRASILSFMDQFPL